MQKSRFVGNKKQCEQIRKFLERATDTGGVLLVSGGRGLGKTRLVDEALNRRNIKNKPTWFDQVFGDVSDSKRYLVKREPNKVRRHIIKIDVDPYFPYFQKGTKQNTTIEPDENALSIALIRNIVVGLTSVLDCRCNQRAYGKTLSAKLGFWKYWFSDNAILWREDGGMFIRLISTLIFLSLVFLSYTYKSLPSLYIFNSEMLLTFVMVMPLFAWVFLRWRDWRALHKMSEKLYALVHAETSGEDRNQTEESKHNKLLIPVLLIALMASLLPDTKDFLIFLNIKESAGVIQGGLAVLFAIGVVWVSSKSSKKHAEYSQDNPVWMITLLKRYLYLCHRCGLEPVLVFDELDKLEDMSHWWQESQGIDNWQSINRRDAQAWNHVPINKPEKLNQFLLTMARFKSSLGAEFLWILIGGSSVYNRLQRDRHRRSDATLGLLATTIHQEVILEPICFDDAKKLEVFDNQLDDKFVKTLWLRSYGNLATLLRNSEKDHYTYNEKTELLAEKLIEVWPTTIQWDYIEITNDQTWLEKLEESWVQSWIHTGMLVVANDLLKKPMSHNEMRNLEYEHWPKNLGEPSEIEIQPAIIILQSEDSVLLMALGKKLLLSYLRDKGCLSSDKNTGVRKQYIELSFPSKGKANKSKAELYKPLVLIALSILVGAL